MANLANYTTADGRTLRLPPELAQNFVGLTAADQPPSVDLTAQPPMGDSLMAPDDVPAQALPAPTMSPGAPAILQPPVPVNTQPMPQLPQQQESKPRQAPRQAAQSAQAAAPQPKTDADLLKLGTAGGLAAQNAAIDKAAEAGQAMADAEAESFRAQADAYAARNKENDRLLALQQQAEAEKLQRTQAATLEANKAVEAYASHKVDRSVDHPVLGAISLALGALGSAMKGDGANNPALNILMQQMDRKVQLQLADRAKLGDVASRKTSAVDQVRRAGDDQIEMYNKAMAGETQRAINKVQEIGARSNSETVKLNAQNLIAQLEGKKAEYVVTAIDRAQTNNDQKLQREQQAKQHAQQIALGYFTANETRRHNKANEENARANIEQEAQKLLAQGRSAEAKAVAERALGGVPDGIIKDSEGKPVLDKEGKAQVRYGLMRKSDGNVWLPDGGDNEVKDLRRLKASTDTLVNLMDEAKRIRTGWTSDTAKSEEWQQLKANWAAARGVAKDVLGLGALSGPDMELVDRFIGTDDPTQFRDPTAGISKSRANILFLASKRFQAAGYDQDYKIPEASQEPVKTAADDAIKLLSVNPSQNPQALYREFGANPYAASMRERYTPEALKAKEYLESQGMTPQQRTLLDSLGKRATGGDLKDRGVALSILEQVAKPRGGSAGSEAIQGYAQQLITNASTADAFPAAQENPTNPDYNPTGAINPRFR